MHNIRTKSIYENFEVYHPNGKLMFKCSEKKIKWYLNRGLAIKIDNNKIKLNFTPKGNGEDSRLTSVKRDNICVCCGDNDMSNLTKHHIIPYNYRKYFPEKYKSRSSIELVAICKKCHYEYEEKAMRLKTKLFSQYSIFENSKKTGDEVLFDKIMSKRKALNKVELQVIKEKISKELLFLENLFELKYGDIKIFSPNKIKNKKEDLSKILVEKINNIDEFSLMWINHFFDNMNTPFIDKSQKEYLINKYSKKEKTP